jgi:D-galacturonate reductase
MRQFTGGNLQEAVDAAEGVGAAAAAEPIPLLTMLMIGTGEYTTGYVHGEKSDSDKGAGVVALTMVDMRRRGKLDRLGLCGTSGSKLPGIRTHMQKCIGDVYRDMDLTMDCWPEDGKT